jgi:uncharacterized protein with ATP-grasp and redox domains
MKKYPRLKTELQILHDTDYLLRTIRNLYRITEAAEDEIHRDQLKSLSELMHKSSTKMILSKDIYKEIKSSLKSSATAVVKIIKYLEKHLD